MSNSDLLAKLRKLRLDLPGDGVDLEEAAGVFERLTMQLEGIPREVERALADLVNDVERIRFALLPEDQVAAVGEVFARTEEIFERYV